jgi:hypothetical protein
MMRFRFIWWVFALAPTAAFGDETAGAFPGDFSGTLRAGIWSTDRDLDKTAAAATSSAWLTGRLNFDQDTSFSFEAWAVTRTDRAAEAELREALLTRAGENFRLSVGRSVIVWGRADKINPTDNIGSRDYTLLFAEDDDQRLGVFTARADIDLRDLTLTALWIPEFRPTVVPIPVMPQGISFGPSKVGTTIDQFALRLDRSGGTVDWSLSWFDGPNRISNIGIASVTSDAAILERVYDRIGVLGVDFALARNQWGFRGEAAYTYVRERGSSTPYDLRSSFFAVAGVERSFDGITINMQGLLHQTADAPQDSPALSDFAVTVANQGALLQNQLRQTQAGLSARLSYRGLNDTIETELEAVSYLTDGGGVLRPKVTYLVSDRIKFILGADVFFGPSRSYYGQLKANSLLFTEVLYGF